MESKKQRRTKFIVGLVISSILIIFFLLIGTFVTLMNPFGIIIMLFSVTMFFFAYWSGFFNYKKGNLFYDIYTNPSEEKVKEYLE